MRKTIFRKLLPVILCVGLFAAAVLGTAGCTGGETPQAPGADASASVTPESQTTDGQTPEAGGPESSVLGEGRTEFTFLVVDGEGTKTQFTIRTDETTVGAALLDLGLIAGEAGEYGLYVKTVNGVTADYDTDGTYWAFYIDGEYAMTGVDATDVVAGTTYSFVVK